MTRQRKALQGSMTKSKKEKLKDKLMLDARDPGPLGQFARAALKKQFGVTFVKITYEPRE